MRPGPVLTAAALVAALTLALHWPVFTEGALVTPAGMHHAQWPWRASLQAGASGEGRLETNHTLSDLLFQVYPWQLHIARSLTAGSIPLWNPYSYAGAPFVANAQSAVFFPLHWPAWLVPSLHLFTIALLVKIVLAGTFMAIFLQGLGMGRAAVSIGAASFALCAFMTSWLGYAHTNAAIWLPLLMHAAGLLALRPGPGPMVLMAAATGAHLLGGHPETSLHITIAAAAWFAWNLRRAPRPRAAMVWMASAAVLGAAASAVQILPFLEYMLGSAALAQRQALSTMDPSLPAGAILTLLVPDRYGLPWNFTYHGPAAWQAVAGYAGAGVLLLALASARFARQAGFFHAMAILSAAIVYGPEAARTWLRFIPLVGIASNNRLILLLDFSLAVLAAWTVQRLARGGPWATRETVLDDPARDRRRTLAAVGASCAVVMPAALWSASGSAGSAAVLTGATAFLALLAVLRAERRAFYLAGLVAVCAVDVFLFAYRFNPHADPARLFPATPLLDHLKRDADADPARGGRMMTVGWTMRPETQMVYRLSSIEGYDAMEFAAYRRLLDRAAVASIHTTGHIPEASRPILDLLGLRSIVTPPGGVVSGDNMTLTYDGPDGRVFVNERALPRISWVSEARQARGDTEALEALASGALDPRSVVLLHDDIRQDGGAGEGGPAPALVLEEAGENGLRIALRGAGSPGWLVVSDAYDPGWKAEVNGERETVRRANLCFRAVPVPAGDATVTMSYRPLSFLAGSWLSAGAALSILGIGVAAGVHWRRRTAALDEAMSFAIRSGR